MLTPEETFLWDCARTWRTPERLTAAPNLDWTKIVQTGRANKMDTLLAGALPAAGLLDQLPAETRQSLQSGAARFAHLANAYAEELRPYLRLSAARRLENVVLKGLSLCINVYGDAAMRPGGDVDILVRKARVYDSIALLEELGMGQWSKGFDDVYYERHHLHLMRGREDTKLWFEIHWALDHPYALLTIDYETMMDRTRPGTLLGEPINELSLPDLLLSLAIHLVKHAVYLPSVLDRPDLPRVILADGMLMYYLDVAELLRQYGEQLDWSLTVELARQWGAVSILGAVLRVCRDYLAAGVPAWVLRELPVEKPWSLAERAVRRMADHKVATYLGQKADPLWTFLVGYNESIVFRPIRLLDMVTYCLPPAGYLQCRYGSHSWWVGGRHFLRALGQYGRSAVDTAYYTWKLRRRLQLQQQDTRAVSQRPAGPSSS
ncbi:MAG: nucleotidyltransferase family protein [Chloroflexota bacterium]